MRSDSRFFAFLLCGVLVFIGGWLAPGARAQSRGLLEVFDPQARSFGARAAVAAEDEAFALTNSASDTLFAVDEGGTVLVGPPGGLFGRILGSGEGLVSNMTRPGSGSSGSFITNNPENVGASVFAYTNGTGVAGYFTTRNDTSRSAALLAQTTNRGSGGVFDIFNAENDYSAVYARTRGLGAAGYFRTTNSSNNTPAVVGFTDGTGEAGFFHRVGTGSDFGPAVQALQEGTTEGGGGAMALFASIDNAENTSSAVDAVTNGLGSAGTFRVENTGNGAPVVNAITNGTGHVGRFIVENAENDSDALTVLTDGTGGAARFEMTNASSNRFALAALTPGRGAAGLFQKINASSTQPALIGASSGRGPALLAVQNGGTTADNIARFEAEFEVKARIDRDGNVFADGTFQGGGADVAEAFDVEGLAAGYAPGDVLVISTRTDRTVERAQSAYSTLVAGVYATKPGLLLSEQGLATDMSERVPMGVVGVLPTRVTLEGGAIARGDLLVTSSTPGAAMKADPERVRVGQVLGKALEGFSGGSEGMIKVLVSVQ